MIVVDTNIIGYLFLINERTVLVEELFDRDREWMAPRLWRSELRNALSLYIRKKYMSLNDAIEIMTRSYILMESREYDVSSKDVLKLVEQSRCSAYDCEFVALAQDLKAPLITVDKLILKEFPETAYSLEQFLGDIGK